MSEQSSSTALAPLLTTKLYRPPPRPNLVVRSRLFARLDEGLRRKLTLISAPAGFGKTTLISAWVAACAQREPRVAAAWLALEEDDHDVLRFLTYLIAAVQTCAPTVGAALLPLLQTQPPPPTEALLTALLNDLARLTAPIILILDDYHLADSQPVDAALTFLLEHLPPHLHLVITTREDPDLPLARLRARAELTELRAKDLRFTPEEAADFLQQAMGLHLSAADIAALENRTEGWIAGLQLAALSLQGETDTAGFIRAFAGDHRYIVDYLVAEILERQPPAVRRFLLQTALLDRFNAPLCAAVTGQPESAERLAALERGNFLIVPLDDQRQWYRYHHLFADVLRAHLRAEQPDQIAGLHHRASVWYEQNALPNSAIHHALLAGDVERAAALIERVVPHLRRTRQEALLLTWLQALPENIFPARPVLSVHYAGTLLQSGRLDGVDIRLRAAELCLERLTAHPETAAELVIVDEAEFDRLPSAIAMYRAATALYQGRVSDTIYHANRIPALVHTDDHLPRGAAAGLLALAYWTQGDLDAARPACVESMAQLEQIGYLSDMLGIVIALADIHSTQGHLRAAAHLLERGLQLATTNGAVLRGTADMHVGLSQIHYEQGDLAAAAQHLTHSQTLGEFAGLPQNRYRWRAAQARIHAAEGDLDGALTLLDEAERLVEHDFFPNVRPIPAQRARLWVPQGNLSAALGWARDHQLTIDDELSYLREYEHSTLARIRLAQASDRRADPSLPDTLRFLERLIAAAQAGNRMGSLIELLVLQAGAHHLHGDTVAALTSLTRALTLAEPEGYVRVFVDANVPLTRLLEEAAQRRIHPDYIRRLLNVTGTVLQIVPTPAGLTEPLSERELEVLRLLATDLTGPEIADQLMVSLNTLRTHTKNIYTKLGANNRLAALHRAEDLHLL
ncbi:MAG: AAA family ATPase [Anaerolineae bacterium]|nr:AAA family ATPase [Anaerolineae bacterium]